MTLEIPDNFELSFSSSEIAEGIKKVSIEINSWFKSLDEESKSSIVALCVLRGGVFFYADLLRHLSFNLEMEFVKILNYDAQSNSRNEAGDPEINLDFEVQGKTILVIDDICESGKTLRILNNKLLSLGAKTVKSAVLIKRTNNTVVFHEDFFACEVPYKDFFVGLGFDDKKLYRHLPDLYKISR